MDVKLELSRLTQIDFRLDWINDAVSYLRSQNSISQSTLPSEVYRLVFEQVRYSYVFSRLYC